MYFADFLGLFPVIDVVNLRLHARMLQYPAQPVLMHADMNASATLATDAQFCSAGAAAIVKRKGTLKVKESARAVSDRDDRLLMEQMSALENANKEVAGDDDSEEEEEGMGDFDPEAA